MPWLPWLISMYNEANVHIFYNIHFSPKYSKYFHNIIFRYSYYEINSEICWICNGSFAKKLDENTKKTGNILKQAELRCGT